MTETVTYHVHPMTHVCPSPRVQCRLHTMLHEKRQDYTERRGLCGDKDEHEPHWQQSLTLGTFWCHADQRQRMPAVWEFRARQARRDKETT